MQLPTRFDYHEINENPLFFEYIRLFNAKRCSRPPRDLVASSLRPPRDLTATCFTVMGGPKECSRRAMCSNSAPGCSQECFSLRSGGTSRSPRTKQETSRRIQGGPKECSGRAMCSNSAPGCSQEYFFAAFSCAIVPQCRQRVVQGVGSSLLWMSNRWTFIGFCNVFW